MSFCAGIRYLQGVVSSGTAICSRRLLITNVHGKAISSVPTTTMTTRHMNSLVSTAIDDYESPLKELYDRMERNQDITPFGFAENDRSFYGQISRPTKPVLACGVIETDLRFTTTSYGRTILAPFVHPNEHAVVLKVSLRKLPLSTDIELDILRDMVGARYNDERHELQLISNQFGSRIENKRHLVSMLDRIVSSCQRLAKEIQSQNGTDQSTA